MANSTDIPISYRAQNGKSGAFALVDRLVIGASHQADVVLIAQGMARQHARLERRGNDVYVTDLNSRTGTFLDGQRLPSNASYIWSPGSPLRVGGIVFSLDVGAPSQARAATPLTSTTFGTLHLDVEQTTLRPRRGTSLAVRNLDDATHLIYFDAAHDVQGLLIEFEPEVVTLPAQADDAIVVRARPQQLFAFGGRFPVRLTARTETGDYDGLDVMVHVRPRYELLVLAVLLSFAAAWGLLLANDAGAVPEPLVLFNAPTETVPPGVSISATATVTEQLTPTATLTATEGDTASIAASATLTGTPTTTQTTPATISATSTPQSPTATATVTPTPCTPCAARGWPRYTVQQGDTLFQLSVAGGVPLSVLAQENCIADRDAIFANQEICLPATRTPVPTVPDLVLVSLSISPARSRWDTNCTSFSLAYDAQVQNLGEAGSASTSLQLAVERNGAQWTALGPTSARNLPVLEPEAATALDGSFDLAATSIMAGDALRLSGRIELSDSNPVNNARNSSAFTVPACDLPEADLSLMQVSIESGAWDAGCTSYSLPYSVRIENVGSASSTAAQVQMRLLNASLSATNNLSLPALVPGGVTTLSGTFNIGDPGADRAAQLEALLYDPALGPAGGLDDANAANNRATSAQITVPECTLAPPEATDEPSAIAEVTADPSGSD